MHNTLLESGTFEAPKSEEVVRTSPQTPKYDPNALHHSMAGIRNEVEDQTGMTVFNGSPEEPKPKRIDHATFVNRLQEHLSQQNGDHLGVALQFLDGITNSSDNIVDKLNEKDGVQMIVQVMIGYIKEHYQEITKKILPNHPTLKKDIDDFVKRYSQNGSPEDLTSLYLAQITHFAYHMIYFGYEPVYSVLVGNGSQYQSFFVLSRSASMVSASQKSPDETHVEYLRIAKRDNPDSDTPLRVFKGTSNDYLYPVRDRRLNLESTTLYCDLSSEVRVIVTKKAPISPHEAAEMTSATTTMTQTFMGVR